MDPMTLAAVGAVVGGSLLLKLVTPALRRNLAKSRTRELAKHRLIVVDGPGGPGWTDAQATQPALHATLDGGEVVVTAPHTVVVTRTRFLWARRHEGEMANEMRQSLAFVSPQPPGLEHPVARWREIADECFVGGLPAAAIDALADDATIAAAVAVMLKEPGQMAASPEDLIFRFRRGPETPEKEVRRALDVARTVVLALETRARALPAVDDGQLQLDETAVSSSGSPFAVRSIDP